MRVDFPQDSGELLRSSREETMRKWCAILAVAAWLVLPLCAQQRAAGTVEERSTAESAAANSAADNDFRIAPASANLFGAGAAGARGRGGRWNFFGLGHQRWEPPRVGPLDTEV